MKNKTTKLYQFLKNLVWILNISYKTNKPLFILRLLVTIVYISVPILSTWTLSSIINSLIDGSGFTVLLNLVAVKIVLDITYIFIDLLIEGLFKIMRFNLEKHFAVIYLSKLNQIPYPRFEDSNFLNLKQKVSETYSWKPTEFLNVSFWILYNITQLIIQGYLLAQINVVWILILYIFQIPAIVILNNIGQSVWNIWDADTVIRRKYKYFTGLFENKNFIIDFKIFNLGRHFINKVEKLILKFHNNQKSIERKRVFKGFGAVLLSNLPVYYIVVHLFIYTFDKQITVGLLTFYLTAITVFTTALNNFVKNINYGFELNNFIEDLKEFLNLKIENSNIDPKPQKKKNSFAIEFNDVSFTYPSNHLSAIKNCTLKIKKGEKVAIVGNNGAGKTTLIKLISGLYKATSGRITINGKIAVLFQDYPHYELKIKESIQLGDLSRKLSNQKIIKACTLSSASKFIEKLPRKYNQIAGNYFPYGFELSVGQWQKLALARVYYADSDIIILDEPTSSIDAESEMQIFHQLLAKMRNKTVIVISHRFNTVCKFKRILVMENGEIVEEGNHKDLMDTSGRYTKMYKLQEHPIQ